jgi:hypothetical protein
MPRAKCRWLGTEMTRAVRAVEKATGKPVKRVEIDQTGKIIVFPGGGDTTDTAPNEWDDAADDEN